MTAITAHSRQKRNRQKSVALFHCLPHTARNAAGRQARQRKSAAFMEKTPDGKIIALDKFTWQRYNNDKKTWKGAILFNE